MNWTLIILGIILFLIFLIIITKLKVQIDLLHHQDNDHFKVTVKAWFGLLSFTYDIPIMQFDEENASVVTENEAMIGKEEKQVSDKKKKFTPHDIIDKIEQVKILLNKIVGLHKIVRKFLRHVSIQWFEWKTVFGVGDAALTGMLTGAVWALKGNTIGIISNYMQLKVKPNLQVQPLFQQKYSHTHLVCMISFRIGHAIVAGLRIVKYWKGYKGGIHRGRTSNTGFDDNSYGKLKAND